ncbi:MAG: exopolyphosphatase [Spirochaetaceae bacterium]|nr:exopolyphosphatase [Spirochaetaceae bacterium]
MRLLTRSDFDGLACGALLVYLGIVDDWKFVHPKDVQDGKVEATENDILANIPYIPGCKFWFDHHSSEQERLKGQEVNGISRITPSCARLIYDYYGGDESLGNFAEMIKYVDKMDSANLTVEEIQNPAGWILLGFIMDPRTGLGRIRNFRVSNYDLMKELAVACRELSITEILKLRDVKERIDVYFEQEKLFSEMVKAHTRVDGPVIITDLRGVDPIYTGNRFLIYSFYPEQNMSMWIVDGKNRENCVITAGYSIINKNATADVGSILLGYGGGGHRRVGTCQVPYAAADKYIAEIAEKLK